MTMAMNVETENGDGSEHQNEDMNLNTKLKKMVALNFDNEWRL